MKRGRYNPTERRTPNRVPRPDPHAGKNVWVDPEVSATQINRRFWRLNKPVVFIDHVGRRWVVPKGFVTDFATVPFPFTLVVPRSGGHNPAAVLHDWLYVTTPIKRREIDLIFVNAMRARPLRVFIPKAGIMWLAVRVGGWFAWVKRRMDIVPLHDRPFLAYYEKS